MRIALDWTPNVNHLGILVAKEKMFFQEQGISVELISPDIDNYALTPGKRLATGQVELAIAPFETVISLNNKPDPVSAVAVYAILQKDLSCIATLTSSGIRRPAELTGKKYASYAARYEDKIVREVIRKDGGVDEVRCVYPDKLGIWNTLLTGEADATWIFDNWEGVEAATQHISLNKFWLADHEIPYGYSPIILARREEIEQRPEEYRAIIHSIKKGYEYAVYHQEEAVSILSACVPEQDKKRIDLAEAVNRTAPHFGGATSCGYMQKERVNSFVQWLVDKKLESSRILEQELFTNILLS